MREEVLETLLEKSAQIWGVDPSTLTEDTEIQSLNPKSVHYTQLTVHLENEFDVEVSFFDFKKCKTFGEAADYVVGLLDE